MNKRQRVLFALTFIGFVASCASTVASIVFIEKAADVVAETADSAMRPEQFREWLAKRGLGAEETALVDVYVQSVTRRANSVSEHHKYQDDALSKILAFGFVAGALAAICLLLFGYSVRASGAGATPVQPDPLV